MDKVTCINSKLLLWAREQMHYTREYVASRINKSIETLSKWEEGEDFPTYIQLEHLSDLYCKPIAIFFFDEVPQLPNISQSFRSISKVTFDNLSPNVIKIMHKHFVLQLDLLEILPELKNKFYNLQLHQSTSLENDLRYLLNININRQKSFKDDHIAFEAWRDAFFNIGLYVFKDKFTDDSVSGFCLHSKDFPVIVVNNSMTFSRQIFTLFHEIYHLIKDTSGIDFNNIDNEVYNEEIDFFSNIERECDRFASNFLIPSDDLKSELVNKHINYELITDLSFKYKVSRQALTIKLFELGMITDIDYLQFLRVIKQTYKRI